MSTRRLSTISHRAGAAGLGLIVAGGVGAGVIALSLAPGAAANIPVAGCSGHATLTATGSGTANGSPDLLTMQIGVQTTARSAHTALAENNARAQTLINTLEQAGVKAADIQTSNLSINPEYNNANSITGYQVDDALTVAVHQISSAGSLIDSAAAKLGNDVTFDGLAFSVSDPSGPMAAARADAIRIAEAEAKAMAQAAGASLGPLCAINDNGSPSLPPIEQGVPVAASGALAAPRVPVQPGSEQFEAGVTVTYRLG